MKQKIISLLQRVGLLYNERDTRHHRMLAASKEPVKKLWDERLRRQIATP